MSRMRGGRVTRESLGDWGSGRFYSRRYLRFIARGGCIENERHGEKGIAESCVPRVRVTRSVTPRAALVYTQRRRGSTLHRHRSRSPRPAFERMRVRVLWDGGTTFVALKASLVTTSIASGYRQRSRRKKKRLHGTEWGWEDVR